MNSLIFVTIIVAICGMASGQETCQTESACVFQISSGHYIDLTELTEITQSNDNAGKDVFQFNPCNAFNCSDMDDALACDKRFVATSVLIPKGNSPACTTQGDNVVLQYTEANTVLTVSLVCTTAMETTLKYESGSPADNDYKFTLTSRYACDNATIVSPGTTGTTKAPTTTGSTMSSTNTASTQSSTNTATTQSTGSTKTTSSTGTTKTTTNTGTTKTTTNTGTTKTTTNTGTTKTTTNTGTTKTTTNTGSTNTTMAKTTMTTPTTPGGNASKNSAMSFLSLTAIILFTVRLLKV